jgi:hypothetical protein
MNTNNEKKSIQDSIVSDIKEGKIKMHSKAFFLARTSLLFLSIFIVFLFVVYLASFIIFSLRISGMWFLPSFGLTGFRVLFGSLPWLLILLAAAMVVLLEFFAEHISFIYKTPAVYSLLGIIGLVLFIAVIIGISPLHTRLFRGAREGGLSVIGSFYRGYGAPDSYDVHNGSIAQITQDGFVIETPNGEVLTVLASQPMKQNLEVGDLVIIIGSRSKSTIHALVLRKIDEDRNFFPAPGRMTPHMHVNYFYWQRNIVGC